MLCDCYLTVAISVYNRWVGGRKKKQDRQCHQLSQIGDATPLLVETGSQAKCAILYSDRENVKFLLYFLNLYSK